MTPIWLPSKNRSRSSISTIQITISLKDYNSCMNTQPTTSTPSSATSATPSTTMTTLMNCSPNLFSGSQPQRRLNREMPPIGWPSFQGGITIVLGGDGSEEGSMSKDTQPITIKPNAFSKSTDRKNKAFIPWSRFEGLCLCFGAKPPISTSPLPSAFRPTKNESVSNCPGTLSKVRPSRREC